MSKTAVVLIVAAGESRRVGGDIPKQYQVLDGKSLLRRSIEAFLQHPGISGVKVVMNPVHQQYYEEHTRGLNLLPPITGGATRQESVKKGLRSFADASPDYVLIHDAARPNVMQETISLVLSSLETAPAIIPAIPVIDTLKHIEDDHVVGTIERKKLYRAQTPQGFHFKPIFDAHEKCAEYEYTDDAAVAEQAGVEVKIVSGSEHNYKITTAEDMRDAQLLLEHMYETRVGFGIDAHKLFPHDPDTIPAKRVVTLCATPIHFDHALEGHSDADVGLHAIVDAMLGAMGEGDIGKHFSAGDPRWRGMNSSRFLLHAYQLLMQKNGKLVHVDVTLICERPHIAPHRDNMIKNLAKLLNTTPSRISVKATTTEKMGFTGRGEGIVAQAVVTIKLPCEGRFENAS